MEDFLARVDPALRCQLRRTLALGFEARSLDDLIAQRASAAAMWADLLGPEALEVPSRDVLVRRRTGGEPLRVRVYGEAPTTERRPGIVWSHGGGMVGGGLEADDRNCARYAAGVGCVVVAVDYRLAPEHPYPAAVDDIGDAFRWLVANGAALGVDPDRIAIAGGSAGGGLTAGVAIALRDAGGPQPRFQLLIRPMLDPRNDTPSAREFSGTPGWNHELNAIGWAAYLGSLAGETLPAAASPATAADLRRLPPAMIQVGELEVFRDEAIAYAARLLAAGVPAELHVYPRAYHGWDTIAPDAPVSRRSVAERIDALCRALAAVGG